MSFEIVTDSSSNLPEEVIDHYRLNVLALEFNIEGEIYRSYLKGRITDIKQFYTMMREGKTVTTSLVSLEDTDAMLRQLFDQGKDVLYLGFSSGLSGTYESSSTYMEKLQREEYPERKLRHVDSLAASLGQGLMVRYAAELREAGKGLDEVTDWLEENKLKFAHWFTVDDLFFLERGGRVSKASAVAGTMLKIKPVLHVDDEGHLIPMEKVRGRKKALNALVDHMAESADQPIDEQTVYISHGDCIEDAEYVAQQIRERFGVTDILINYVDPVIGAHSGPGTIALFFIASHR